MKPTKDEIEKAIGEKIPDDAPIEEISSLPPPQDPLDNGIVFKACSTINTKWKIFLATSLGEIVGVYLLAITVGFPVPKPLDLVFYTAESFINVSSSVYEYLGMPKENAEGYLVSFPENYAMPVDVKQIGPLDLPPGSGIYPVSGAFLGR